MKKIEKRLTRIIREMTKNACEEIGYPFDEMCVEIVLNDLQHDYNVVITDNTKIDYRLMLKIAQCVEQYAIETEWHNSEEIIEHHLKNNK